MPNLVKISRQIGKFSLQRLEFDLLVCIIVILVCFSSPISAVSTYEQPLPKKRTCAKFQIDISKTEGLLRVYTNKQRDIAKLSGKLYVPFPW